MGCLGRERELGSCCSAECPITGGPGPKVSNWDEDEQSELRNASEGREAQRSMPLLRWHQCDETHRYSPRPPVCVRGVLTRCFHRRFVFSNPIPKKSGGA